MNCSTLQSRLSFAGWPVFVGGCTLDAAEAVMGDGQDATPVLDMLGSLVDKSLWRRTQDTGAGPQLDA